MANDNYPITDDHRVRHFDEVVAALKQSHDALVDMSNSSHADTDKEFDENGVCREALRRSSRVLYSSGIYGCI